MDTPYPVDDPALVCSRCGQPIPPDDLRRVPAPSDPGLEYRYHLACTHALGGPG